MNHPRNGGLLTRLMICFALATGVCAYAGAPPLQTCGYGTLYTVAMHPLGEFYASAGRAGIEIWSLPDGIPIRHLETNSTVFGLAFSPNGQELASVEADRVVFWDINVGQALRTISNPGAKMGGVAYSQDGTRVVTWPFKFTEDQKLTNFEFGNDADDYTLNGTAAVWDAISCSALRTISDAPGILCAAISADGSQVLTGGHSGVVNLWNAGANGAATAQSSAGSIILSVAFSQDGSRIAAGQADSTIRLLTNSLADDASFSAGANQVAFLSFRESDSCLYAITENAIRVFSITPTPGTLLKSYPGSFYRHGTGSSGHFIWDLVDSVSLTSDSSTMVSRETEKGGASEDAVLRWQTADPEGTAPTKSLGHFSVAQASASADGQRVLVGYIGSVTLYDVPSGSPIFHTIVPGGYPQSFGVLFPESNKYVTTDWKNAVTVWSMDSSVPLKTYPTQPDLGFIEISPDEHYLAAGNNSAKVRVFDLLSPSTLGVDYSIPSGGGYINGIQFTPDSTHFVACCDNVAGGATMSYWEVGNTSALSVCTMPLTADFRSGVTVGLKLSPDGTKALCTDYASRVHLWDLSSPTPVQTYDSSTFGSRQVTSAVFTNDPTKFVAGGSLNGQPTKWGLLTVDFSSGTVVDERSGHFGDFPNSDGTISRTQTDKAFTKVFTGSTDGRVLVWELSPARAMVVAGGGDFAGNGIALQTNDLSAYAYKTLRARGYSASDVQYISAFADRDADGDGLNDVDGLATLDSFHNTLTSSFATATGRLLILMLDHGYKTDNFMAFRMNQTQALPSTTLDTWLDDLQTSYPVDVTLVVDSCYSGKIVDDCSTAPAGRKRIVISSTTRDAEAVFCPSPDLSSFMYTFLGSAYMGNSIGEAWRAGRRFFETFPVANQIPQISDGSTSTTNADREFFGNSWTYGVQSTTDINQFFPAFSDWSTTQAVAPSSPVNLYARTLAGQDPTSVTCVVRPPAPAVLSGDPITTLPRLTMVRRSSDVSSADYRIWETTSTETFAATGSYTVSFSAQFANERVSNPAFTNVTVSAGTDPDQTEIRAVLAVGSTTNSDMSSAFLGLGPFAYTTYLSRFADNSGVHHPEWINYYANYTDANKDGAASSSNVTNSINNLPNTIGRLYVHIIGDSSAQGGVRMASGDILTASALDTALDALQSRQTCAVVLIIDAPFSGSFLDTCKSTGGQQRVVMTSGKSGDQAMFLAPPLKTSFSEKVLGAGLQGNDLNTAFNSGKKFFGNFKRSITPQLDDNGSGSYNGQDGSLANTIYLGRRYAFAGDEGSGLPFLLDATTTQTVAPGTYVQYKTTLIEGVVPSRVYLQLTPDSTSDLTPIAQVPTIDLTRDNATSWTWSANFYAPTPASTYAMVLYADYPNATQVKPTEPQYTGLIVTGTPTTAPIKDMDGDGYEDAVELRAGTSPLDASAHPSGFPYDSSGDSDGDGFKDFYEYELGYNPSSASSYPSLSDINGDGTTNGADAIILKRIAVGTVQATDFSIANMDLNRDGVINGADAIILQRYVVHTVTALPTN